MALKLSASWCVSNILAQRKPCSTKALQFPQWNRYVNNGTLVNINNNTDAYLGVVELPDLGIQAFRAGLSLPLLQEQRPK